MFTSFLLVSCAGSKCYEYSNVDSDSSDLTIEKCDPYYSDFCATDTFRNGFYDNTCGDEEFCTVKACHSSSHCKEPGTYEYDYPGYGNYKSTTTCCDKDLCNI